MRHEVNTRRSHRPRQSRSAKRLIAAGLLLGAVIAVAAAFLARDLHDRAIGNTERNLTSLSLVLADQADRALQTIELVQQAIIDEMRADGIDEHVEYVSKMSAKQQHEALRARIAALPQVNAISLIDRWGNLVNFSRYWPIPEVNIADRDYFKLLSTDASLQRMVSQPFKNRGDGAWTIYIARKLTAPNGTFLGLVLGAVELRYFENLYAQIAPNKDDVISVFRTDGTLLVRHPFREDTIGRSFPGAGALRIAATGASAGGLIRNVSPIDGLDRIIATRAVSNYPLILSVSSTANSTLAPWKRQAVALGLGTLLLEVGLVLVLVLGVRQIRGKETLVSSEAARSAAEERERGERVLREQYAQFGIALNSMTHGVCMFDGDDNLIVMNER